MSERADDIRQLLRVALDEEPAAYLSEQLMARLAAVITAVEFGRLLGLAPVDWLVDDERGGPGEESRLGASSASGEEDDH